MHLHFCSEGARIEVTLGGGVRRRRVWGHIAPLLERLVSEQLQARGEARSSTVARATVDELEAGGWVERAAGARLMASVLNISLGEPDPN